MIKVFQSRRAQSGLTVIELIIAVAGMTVVAGLAYGIYDETQKASVKMSTRQAAIDWAVRVNDEIASLLYNSVAPGNFDQPGLVQPAFEKNRLVVPAFPRGASEGLYQIEIRPAAENTEGVHFERHELPIAAATGNDPVAETTTPIGGKTDQFTPQISFRYAASADPGNGAAYTEVLNPGEWPALIEVTIRIELPDYPTRPVLLQNAFIPGYLPKNDIIVTEPSAAPSESAPATDSNAEAAP
jgi:hypothetical protein